MKRPCAKQFMCACLIVAMGVFSSGCRPSVREVADLLYKVPLGSSRDDLSKVLVQAYGKKYPNWKQAYALTDSPSTVTSGLISADVKLISDFKRDHRYVRVYPSDLYDKMPAGALVQGIGIVAEASDGNGSVAVFYDNKTNYIGFLSFSSGNDK